MVDQARIFDGRTWHEADLEEFFRLPEGVWLRHVLEGTVVFVRDGVERDVREVLTERNLGPAGPAPEKPRGNERGPTRRLRSVK